MSEHYSDPELIRQAKKLAAGPLGDQVSAFSRLFSLPVIIAPLPSTDAHGLTNGTVSLLELPAGRVGITCEHVVREYRDKLLTDDSTVFQIGNTSIKPLDRLISESSHFDIACIDLSGLDPMKMAIATKVDFYHPASWPPKPVTADSYLTLTGYPGEWRLQPGSLDIYFDSFDLGMTKVSSVSETNVITALERDFWVTSELDNPDSVGMDLTDFGGMSGAPVFSLGKLAFEFVGIVYESSALFDSIMIRPAGLIGPDGTIEERPI